MPGGSDGWPLLGPDSLDERTSYEWQSLSEQVVAWRGEPDSARANVTLEAAVTREPASPVAPAYRLWIADNLAHDGRLAEALTAYDQTVESAFATHRTIADLDLIAGALYHKAQAAALLGDVSTAITAYTDLSRRTPSDADPLFQAGLLAEAAGQTDQAADFYQQIARESPSKRTDDPAELARRALLRLDLPPTDFAPEAEHIMSALDQALQRGDADQLRRMVSATHFTIGTIGGHTIFETEDLLDELLRDLAASRVTVGRQLLGSGAKRYLHTGGWQGRWFSGDVVLLITGAPGGWQWTGVAPTLPNELWLDRWHAPVAHSSNALPFELLAPWPAGQCFTAGGIEMYAVQQAEIIAVLAAGGWFGWIAAAALALQFSTIECGFGPRGFYYNTSPTHDEEDAFAIDFTRYRQYVPYYRQSGGTPVLAARAGVVVTADAGTPSGIPSKSNTVEIEHPDPDNPTDTKRFTSRYLHLEGPWTVKVSKGMAVPAGKLLGYMDDTGNSVLDHLHFSIHDRTIPYSGYRPGASVRPSPMSGVRLADRDSGACVCSTNVERGKPVIEAAGFAGQNWLVTPAARAVNQPVPPGVQDEKWLLVLSGVATLNVQGNSESQWRHETVSLRPDLTEPLQYAITQHSIPTPPGSLGATYWAGFQVEQWAPFAALSSMLNLGESINSGFAVDVWRPNPFQTMTGFSNTQVTNLFDGIQVDVAVRDTDAILSRLSYNIVLLGRIVFGPVIIS